MFEGIKDQEVHVTPSTSHLDGGCNGCCSYMDTHGQIPHRVWKISLRGCSFRVCDECKKELLKLLTK